MNLELKMNNFIELMSDKEFRHSFNGAWIAFTLSKQIKSMRIRKGWTQKDLEIYSGIPQSNISKLERMTPTRFPSIGTLRKIANVFDVQLTIRFDSWANLFNEFSDALQNGVQIPRAFDDDVIFGQQNIGE